MNVMVSLSNTPMAHPPRSNPFLRSSSVAWPFPCITPSTVTCVMVVSFMVAVPFSSVLVVVRSDRAAPISSVVARTVPQNLAHLLPPSIRVPSMVLRDGWRGIHRKVARVGRVLRGPSDTCSASFAGHRRARLPRTLLTRTWVNTLTLLGKETRVDAFLVERLDKLPHHLADRTRGSYSRHRRRSERTPTGRSHSRPRTSVPSPPDRVRRSPVAPFR